MNLLLNTPPLPVCEHMALDDFLARENAGRAVLRFYHWTSAPAVTFGYAQFIREVRRTLGEQLFSGNYTRRPTGGGVVFHREDLTFSLIFEHAGRPTEIYKNLHQFILRGLAGGGSAHFTLGGAVSKEAYRPSTLGAASACFVRPVENDILTADGHKILGGALRRYGSTVLYQGSLQLPSARQNPAYKKAVTQAVRAFLGVDFTLARTPETYLAQARQLSLTQYQTTAWKEKF